jgi:hypothetical protein
MRLVLITAALFFAFTPAHAEGWTCSAPGMVSGSYDGGNAAYIHLTGFSTGGTYPVTRNGKRATGTTKNGTKFVCVLH